MTTTARVSAEGIRLAMCSDTFAPQVNGVARTLERMVQAFEHRGGAIHVETVQVPDAIPDPRVTRWESVPFWAYPQLRMAAPARARMRSSFAAFRPTLVHATTPFGVGLAGRAAARVSGVPFVSSYHTSFSAYLRHYNLTALDAIAWPFQRWFHNSGLRTWAPSRLVAAELEQHGFTDVGIWARGVDPARFHPRFRSAAMRAEMGAHAHEMVVAYVGRLAPEKGVHTAIEAMRGVMARYPGRVRFALAGDGPDDARCRATAPAGTWFAGSLAGERLSAFYASADVFVFPSTTETFGNVVLEAMASGLPVVGPDVGATLELANERTALTFTAADAAALGAQVERLLHDPALRDEKRTAGLAVAASRTWDAVWDALVRDYRAVLAPAASSSPVSVALDRVA
jgi:glycosyltransferase involved in cell wall biosynthesis